MARVCRVSKVADVLVLPIRAVLGPMLYGYRGTLWTLTPHNRRACWLLLRYAHTFCTFNIHRRFMAFWRTAWL
jgi:hypothetical protein